MRIITIISGILFVLSGLWCIVNQGVTFAALAFVLGLVMIIVGLIGVMGFFSIKDRVKERVDMAWSLEEAIITAILGGVVLSNQLVTDLMVVMFFGMWLLFSGCNRLIASWTMKKQEHKGWRWICVLAAASLIAGVYSFFNVTLKGLDMGMLVGIFFLIQGVNILGLGVAMPRSKVKSKIA